MIAALSVIDAVQRLYGVTLSIKWVNDILFDGRKLSGILTEASMDGESGGLEFAAVGIGINFRGRDQFPTEIASKAAVLEEVTNLPLSRSKLCGAILDEFWRQVSRILRHRGDQRDSFPLSESSLYAGTADPRPIAPRGISCCSQGYRRQWGTIGTAGRRQYNFCTIR